MSLFLLIFYIAVFVAQIVLFVLAVKRKTNKNWLTLFLAEIIPMIISLCLMIYYNNLPGYGFMPGLSYLAEVLFSFGATVLYGVLLLVSICSFIVIKVKNKNNL